MTLAFPFGYSGPNKTIEQIKASATWRNSHPELQLRVEAMMMASGGAVGPGTMWRDPVAQDRERARRLATHTGAQMAPSAASWHCAGGAIDVVGDQHWAKENCHLFGLYYATWAGESLWHQQLVELPHARPHGAAVDQFVGHHEIVAPDLQPPPVGPEPGFPPFDPAHGQYSLWPLSFIKPNIRIGFRGDAAKYAQAVMKRNGGPNHAGVVIDGNWGTQSARHWSGFQRFFGLPVNGRVEGRDWSVIDMLAAK